MLVTALAIGIEVAVVHVVGRLGTLIPSLLLPSLAMAAPCAAAPILLVGLVTSSDSSAPAANAVAITICSPSPPLRQPLLCASLGDFRPFCSSLIASIILP